MKKQNATRLQNTRFGFTVVEMVVVIIVIGILATLGVSAYNGAQLRAYDIAIIADADAMDSALTNMQINDPAGVVAFADIDSDGEDDGYHYSNELENDPTIKALNSQLDFKPTRDNIIDVKTTSNGKEYCIRVYNEKAKAWNNPFNAYEVSSSRDITGGFNSCEYEEGAEPTVYSGGAIPGAYEEIFSPANNSPTLQYDWTAHAATDGTLPERIEIAIIGAGGAGNGYCGGGSAGVWTAVIPRTGNPGPFHIVVGAGAASGSTGAAASSSFGIYVATGGTTPPNACNSMSLGTINEPKGGAGGTTNGPDGLPSHKYGAGGMGSRGGTYLTLGLLAAPQAPGAITGGGGAGGSTGLFPGTKGGDGTYGGGGGGGSGYTLLICSAPGSGGNASGGGAGQNGGSCSGNKGGPGGKGGLGSGGGGSGASSGVSPGAGGDGQVRVLTCFESTCNPISTPIP